MGLIWSRFRSKTSTKDVLEDIEKKLKSIEEFQQDTLERKKRVVRRLLVITVIVYLLAVVAFLVINSVRNHKLYYFGGLFIFALLIWALNKILRWHYTRRMQINAEKSVELRKRKQKILEEVMDTETYKVAKEILDKFGDKATPKPLELKPSVVHQGQQHAARPQPQMTPGTELRQRHVESKVIPPRTNMQPQAQPVPTHMSATPSMKLPQQLQSVQRPVAMNYGHAPLRPLPRPILPRERGVVDRVMDFFVGDGPNQRFALVCRHCGGHNGMALQEEFEFISYYCCYCFQFNPARKQRPMGPRLPIPAPIPATPRTPPSQSEGADKQESKEANKSGDEDNDSESSSETDESDGGEESAGSKSQEADDTPPKADETSERMEVDHQDEEPASDSVCNDETGPGLR